MRSMTGRVVGGLTAVATIGMMLGCGSGNRGSGAEIELVNVSYDPTRELYAELNEAFVEHYATTTGKQVKISQSHGGSGSQARAVIDGLKADVVTLALAGDIEAIHKRGLIKEGWQGRLKDNSSPYTSTIVFIVRAGNPKNIQDWPDLIRPDVKVITPDPKTSGGARWNFLAAWGYKTFHEKKSEQAAEEFVRQLYARVPKLDTGARGSTETFLQKKQGDVLLAWENEAILVKQEADEPLQIVRPSITILAEPPVAVVDKYVDQRGTREVAEAYLKFLYTPMAQDIIGKHGYRPRNKECLKKYESQLPPFKHDSFTITDVAGGWDNAQQKFFTDGGVFDRIYERKAK